jgi:hypothetical protein
MKNFPYITIVDCYHLVTFNSLLNELDMGLFEIPKFCFQIQQAAV